MHGRRPRRCALVIGLFVRSSVRFSSSKASSKSGSVRIIPQARFSFAVRFGLGKKAKGWPCSFPWATMIQDYGKRTPPVELTQRAVAYLGLLTPQTRLEKSHRIAHIIALLPPQLGSLAHWWKWLLTSSRAARSLAYLRFRRKQKKTFQGFLFTYRDHKTILKFLIVLCTSA